MTLYTVSENEYVELSQHSMKKGRRDGYEIEENTTYTRANPVKRFVETRKISQNVFDRRKKSDFQCVRLYNLHPALE